MIAYTHIHSGALERVKGVFAGVSVMVLRCEVRDYVRVNPDADCGYNSAEGGAESEYLTMVVSDRILVIRLEDLDTVKDRCENFGIKGFRWTAFDQPSRYSEYAYRAQSGNLIFHLIGMRAPTHFRPTVAL